ncbi:hypothetical protein HYDPIDRAFT_112448 [Hydnomerulius pinastri MD-312]|uniref:Uncharacterized protein n=1 Tax=Hydnomerulius pinastri MD-312 TaxID=994086 RepID=A0A0C9VEH0_9AGAM|nr:hypothetical protein HYDPIDRAFT_112448 [Hydnomerulius pinastri MD-312]
MKQRLIARLTSRVAFLWVQSLTHRPKVVFASKAAYSRAKSPIHDSGKSRIMHLQTSHPHFKQFIHDTINALATQPTCPRL